LVKLNPNSDVPPPTDHGVVEPFWYSFDPTHRRVQEGGWTHQVTSRELPVSKDIAGVNMRLTKGSFRELHWHLADEWAIMLTGKARVTLFSLTALCSSTISPRALIADSELLIMPRTLRRSYAEGLDALGADRAAAGL
jgi:cupin